MVDTSNLKEKLKELTGYDFIAVENEERAAGNTSFSIASTPSFYARLAARALGVNPHDLMALPVKKFTKVWTETAIFLNRDLDEDTTDEQSSMKMSTPATTSEG